MADNQYGLEAQWQLNRLAGTLDANKRPLYDIDEAANIWAGTVDLPLVAALNYKAGLTGFDRKDFVGVCNVLAGTTGLGAPKALSLIPDALGTLGQDAVFWIDANRGGTAGQRISNLGTAGSLLDVQVGSTGSAGLQVVPGSHVYLPGVANNFISVPDENALDITGDIDVRVVAALDDWTPAAASILLSKRQIDLSWQFYVETSGALTFYWSPDGSTPLNATSTVATNAADGSMLGVRVTLDVNNGASGNTATFYTSTDMGATWTQLGSKVTYGGTTSIYSGSSRVEIGSRAGGTSMTAGKFYRAQVFNGIDGTKVLDVDCAQATTTSSLFTAVTGQTVTINRSGVDSNDPRWLLAEDKSYVYLPSEQYNYLSVPDENALDITGDLDVRAYLAMDDWTPANFRLWASKYSVSAGNYSWRVFINTDGTLGITWSADGTNTITKNSTVAPTISDGAALWIRTTLDVDNGASGNDVKFWTSTDGITWSQLGSTVTTAGVTSIYSGNAVVTVGPPSNGFGIGAKFYRAIVKNGIDGTTVLDVDCSVLKSGSATSFTALTGQTVTINRSTSGRKTVVVPSRVLEKVDDKHVYLPGGAGNSLSIPHVAGQQVGDTLDVRVDVSTDSLNAAYAGKGSAISAAGLSWYFGPSGSNIPTFAVADGTNLINVATSVAPPVGVGGRVRLRATYQRNTGSGQYAIAFFFSTDFTTALKDITSWTQFGSTLTGASIGATSDLNQPMFVGTFRSTAAGAAGKYYGFSLDVNGVNTVLIESKDAPLNFTAGTANSFTAKTGQTVTMNSTAGSGMLVVDARSATGSSCWLFGTDDYLEVANRWVDGTSKNVYLPGVAGNYLSAPDSSALDVTGDIDIRVKVALDDWTPAAAQVLLAKEQTSASRSYVMLVTSAGNLRLRYSANGSTQINVTSTAVPTVTDGSTLWVRVTLDVDNGASGNDVKFFTSTDGSTWTQLGTTVTTAGVTSIFASTSILELGSSLGGTAEALAGEFFRAQIRNGIDGTVVFDANMETSITSVGQTSFTESSSNAATVTINRSGTGYVSTGVTQSGYIYPTGVANLTPAAVSLLDFGASDSFTVLAVARRWATFASSSVVISKTPDPSALSSGYAIRTLASGAYRTTIADNVTLKEADTLALPSGALGTIGGVGTANSSVQSYINGLAGSVVSSALGSLANANSLRIGRAAAAGTYYADMELVAVAVFRKALTAAEIKAIVEYYQRTVK